MFDAHRDDPEFGYRFLVDEAGGPTAEGTAWKICSRQAGGRASGKKRCKNGKKPGPPVRDDLRAVTDRKGVIRHEFNATAANELWLADVTEHWTAEGSSTSAIKDA